jgi:hypothetical protein
MTVGAHRKTRELYRGFPRSSVTSSVTVKKVIGGKRDRLRHLLIRNYEPPREPIHMSAAGQVPLMDLFGFAACP